MTRTSSRCFAVVALALAVLVGAGAANANFKGSNSLIAFDSWTGTSQDIGVFDPSGTGTPTMLTTTADFSEHAPRWSPDGERIVYWAIRSSSIRTSDTSRTSG
jgi:hypothetical protein